MSTKTKIFGALAMVSVLTVVSALPAGADNKSQTSEPSIVITAGSGPRFDDVNGDGIFPTVNDFQGVTLNGTPQLTSASIDPFTVVDDSGALAGWNVTLQIPDLKNGTGAGCATGSTKTLDATGTSMNPPVVAVATSDTSMTGVTPAGFTDFTSAQKIVVATATNGMGTYTVSPQILKLIVPSQTKAGTYCSTATIAIASGP